MNKEMSSLTLAVNEFNRLSEELGYDINPPYKGTLPTHDFGRGITQLAQFWLQYNELLRISNGLSADGHTCYGLSTASNEPGLIEFNDALNTPGLNLMACMGVLLLEKIILIRSIMTPLQNDGSPAIASALKTYGNPAIRWQN